MLLGRFVSVGPLGPFGVIGSLGPLGVIGSLGSLGEIGPFGLLGPPGALGPAGLAGRLGALGPLGMGAGGIGGALGPMGAQLFIPGEVLILQPYPLPLVTGREIRNGPTGVQLPEVPSRMTRHRLSLRLLKAIPLLVLMAPAAFCVFRGTHLSSRLVSASLARLFSVTL